MKTSTIAIIAVVAIAVVAIGVYAGLTLLGPKAIDPNKFDVAYVRGLPSEGTYTVYFSLRDSSQNLGAADGSVRAVVRDSRYQVLYDIVKEVKASEFKTYDVTGFGSFLGYAWDIPTSAVAAGAPYSGGTGELTLTLTSKSAFVFSKATTMPIPSLPVVDFDFEVTSDGPDFAYGYSLVFNNTHYANDQFEKTITFVILPETTIYAFEITSGFTLVSVDPAPPALIGIPGTTFTFLIQAPNYAYDGPLVIQAITTPPVGAMAIGYREIISNTQMALQVINIGSTTLTVNQARVVGHLESMNPVVLPPGQVQIVTIIGNGTDWAAYDESHWYTVIIKADDGTSVTTTLPYVPPGHSAMAIDGGIVNSDTQIAILLRNMGHNSLYVNSVYVDHILYSVTPVAIATNQTQVVTITGSGTNWTSGLVRNILVYASDGTPADFNIVVNPSSGQGSMSFDSYSFTDSTHLTIYVRNTGTKTLVIANAFLDGAAASLSPQGHDLASGQVYGYTITFATSVGSGIAHQLRIVASDGTPLQISIVRS